MKKLELNKCFLEALQIYKSECDEQGFIPTIDLYIEQLQKEIEVETEANRINQHND